MTVLIIDCNNLCYSSFYTFGELSYEEKKTGVVFGFLQRILFLAKKFETNRFFFCWDSRKNYRKIIYPQYKQNRRKDLSEQEQIDLKLAFKQFDQLREEVLPGLGFGNIFRQNGYEADDLIAKISKQEGDMIVVSTDKDLYQLLNYCNIYNQRTKKIITFKDFVKKYDIAPRKWAKVKAIMGDPSDNIKGIAGVGEVYALKYMHRELKEGKILDKIIAGRSIINRNIKLIKLPFKGKKKINITFGKDNFSKEKFIDVFVDFGFESFLKKKELEKWVNLFI